MTIKHLTQFLLKLVLVTLRSRGKVIKLLVLIILAFPSQSWADTAVCNIEVENINAEVKSKTQARYIIEHIFTFKSGASALKSMQRTYFNLPDDRYFCQLAFLDLQTGTSLSCEKNEDGGYTYMQADQSGIKVKSGTNQNITNLTFRDELSHFVITAKCS
jgi:hypothetical protein